MCFNVLSSWSLAQTACVECVALFWLSVWTACSSVSEWPIDWVRSWIGLNAKRPFFPTGGADGSSPVHKVGRCYHQTLHAGCKNTHKLRHINLVCMHLCACEWFPEHVQIEMHALISPAPSLYRVEVNPFILGQCASSPESSSSQWRCSRVALQVLTSAVVHDAHT